MKTQEQLESAIVRYNDAYRQGVNLVTDEVYDLLIDQLKEEFPNSKLLTKGVFDKVKDSRKQKLPIYMGSLNKIKNIDELAKWVKSKGLSPETIMIITPKYDGISLVVNEKSKECWTRGDGEIGQVSTEHFKRLNRLDFEDEECFFSYGEAIMSRKNFEKYKDKYANPRNMVAGLFNRDIPGDELESVDYIRYGMSMPVEKSYQLNILNNLNRVDVKFSIFKLSELNEKLMNILYQSWSINYQIDGLVIDIDGVNLREGLGREENMNPAYAVAYKSPEWSSSAEVKVTGVEWKVSKQGKLKPVIQIEPTEVAGVVISNVTGYNAKYIFDNNITEGSIIKIVRSGDVIPKHIETLSFSENDMICLADEMIECPCCDQVTLWDETMTELICKNPNCKEKLISKLVHFFSVMEIEDFGEPSIIKLFDEGHNTIEGILSLDYNVLPKIDGYGLTSAEKLLKQFHKLKMVGVPFAKFLHAIDVFEGKIGEKTVQLILDNIDDTLPNTTFEDLIKISGVSDVTANIFIKGLRDSYDFFGLAERIKISYFKSPKQEVVGDKYKGQKICFTGCRPSKEMQGEIESQGGEVVSGVSNKTTILVVKDKSEATLSSSKAKKAVELNIRILTINEL